MLIDDFKEILENISKKIKLTTGINLKKNLNENDSKYLQKLLLNYFNFKSKTLSNQKYDVECSNEIKVTLINLNEKYRRIFHVIKNKIINGESIIPYHSKYVAEFIDNQFYQYGINHLHLNEGVDKKNPNFINRSDYLLLYLVKDTKVYFIDIVEHIENEEWVSQKYWDIFNKNWPEHNQHLKLKSVTDVNPNYSLKEKEMLLKSNITIFNQSEDGVYTPFVPIAGNGAPVIHNMYVKKIISYIRICQDLIVDEKWLNKQKFLKLSPFDFKLIFKNGELWLFEIKNNSYFELEIKDIFK